MLLHDPIYGDFQLVEPVLLELLKDPTVRRIEYVMQGGPTPIICGWKDFSRLDHCIGVMLLVRKLGGTIEEQIAALLHDVPHTAFSHVIDIVFSKNDTQNYHEEIKDSFILNSGIPKILEKHGFDIQFILNEENFGLLERSSPDLCADRLDYALRCNYYYNNDLALSRELAAHLIVHNKEIVFDSIESAVTFGLLFSELSRNKFAGTLNLAAYRVLADAIKRALDTSILSLDDLLLTDREVWSIMESSNDEYIINRLHLLNPTFSASEVPSSQQYHYELLTKKRWVRPKAFQNNHMMDSFEYSDKLNNEYADYSEWIREPRYVLVKNL